MLHLNTCVVVVSVFVGRWRTFVLKCSRTLIYQEMEFQNNCAKNNEMTARVRMAENGAQVYLTNQFTLKL